MDQLSEDELELELELLVESLDDDVAGAGVEADDESLLDSLDLLDEVRLEELPLRLSVL